MKHLRSGQVSEVTVYNIKVFDTKHDQDRYLKLLYII